MTAIAAQQATPTAADGLPALLARQVGSRSARELLLGVVALVGLLLLLLLRHGSNPAAPFIKSDSWTLKVHASSQQQTLKEPSNQGWWETPAELNALLAAAAAADAQGWRSRPIDPTTSKDCKSPLPAEYAQNSTALLAVPTANVWDKTQLLLMSLAHTEDRFELLVVDELSTDGTPAQLQTLGVQVVSPTEPLGLTHNWNLAYQRFKNSSHDALFIINNDVLIPKGVIQKLMEALTLDGGGCDLVTPMSTGRGKGTWGSFEGLEQYYKLSHPAIGFVNNPLNFARVQRVLDLTRLDRQELVINSSTIHNIGFSGFFFAVGRSISKAEFDAEHLFDPSHRIVGQEGELFQRAMLPLGMKVCLHTGTFVYHYKGATIPGTGDEREAFVRPGL